MKKEKNLVSKIDNKGFSFSEESLKIDDIFPGHPPYEPTFDEKGNNETDSIAELEHVLTWLKWSDEHPPHFNGFHGRTSYFCIVFESREQRDTFLREHDLYRYGDMFLQGEHFAEAFGINLETGKRDSSIKQSGMAFGKTTLGFSTSMNFGTSTLSFETKKKKNEISEKLKDIRASEKELAKLMEWRADPAYYTCLGFRTEKEKQNLLKALGLSLECNDRFLWCYDLAKALDVELIPCPYKNKNAYAGSEKGLEGMI